MEKSKVKLYVLIALIIGMMEISILNFVPHSWTPPYFAFILLIDCVILQLIDIKK